MSGFDPYKLWVEFRVNDETYAGFSELKKSIASSAESVAALKKELAEVRANSMVPTSAIAARREMLAMAKQEASLRERMALSVDSEERKVLATKIKALDITREQMGLQRQSLVMQEQAEAAAARAAAAAERQAIADAKAAASARKAGMRSIGKGIHNAGHIGTNMMWTGAGILGVVSYATQKAADFNQTTFEADLALGGYTRTVAQRDADMRALQKAAFAASNATGFFSAQQIMEGLKVAATSGMRPIVEKYGMGSFTEIAPALAQYMDIQGRLKHEDSHTAAKEAVQVAHMFGAYTPDAMAKVWNEASILSLAMPDEFKKAINLMSYTAPTGHYLGGMSPAAVMAFAATADQSGMTQRGGGARLKDYINTFTTTLSAKRELAKAELGLGGAIDENGNFDISKSFQILQADQQKYGKKKYRDLATVAFGQQGIVVAGMFGDKSKADMYQQNKAVIESAVKNGSLKVIQNLLKSFGITGQEAIAITRLTNDMIEFGQAGIPIATAFFDTINPELKEFGNWIQAHPNDMKRYVNDAVKVGIALLEVGAALKAIEIVSGVVKSIQMVAAGFRAVRAVLTGANLGAELASTAGGMRSLAGGLGLLRTGILATLPLLATSGNVSHDEARAKLISLYGLPYYNYLKKRHPHSKPYSFDTSQGDLSPGDFYSIKNTGHLPGEPLGGALKGASLTPRLNAQRTPHVTVQGVNVSFNLAPGTSEEQGAAAVQHFLHLMGVFAPHPAVPNPLTIGGSNLLFGT